MTALVIVADPATRALAGAVLAASGVVLFPLAGACLRFFADERPRFFARWGFSHVGIAILAGMLAATVYFRVLAPEGGDVLQGLLASVFVMGTVALVAALHARRLNPEGLRALGFPSQTDFPAWRAVAGALLAYVLVLPVVHGLEAVWPVVQRALEIPGEAPTLLQDVAALEGWRLAAALAIGVLVGPALEEIVFRGYLQPLLVQNFSEKGGIVVTAFLFAALHGAYAFLPLFGLALLLGIAKLRTQRLVASFAVHAANNALALFLAIRPVRDLVQ